MKTANSSAFPTAIPTQEVSYIQGAFEVSLSPDEMKAHLLIRPSACGDVELTLEEVRRLVEKSGVCFGFDQKVVERVLEERIYNQKVQIAQGENPVPGEDARLEFAFDIMPKSELVIGEDERVVFGDWSVIQAVKAGQLLVRKIKAKPGEFGTTVSGKKLLVPGSKDLKLPIGLNTMPDPTQPLNLISRIDGAVLYKSQRVHVQPLEILRGSVDYTVGNINYVGSLKISGSIKKGFCITLDGNLEVEGRVEDALLKVGGDVLIKAGLSGSGKGTVDCRGKLITAYIQNQAVISGEDVLVGGEIINADIMAVGGLKAVGPRGIIVGGDCAAGKAVEAEILGDSKGTNTKIRVAYDRDSMEEYTQIEYELDKLSQDAQRVKGVLYSFEKMAMDGQLSNKDQSMLKKLKDMEKNIHPQMKKLHARREELETQINKSLDGGWVIARQKAYPGVELYFGTLKYSTERELGPTVFEAKDGEIRIMDYKSET